MELIKEIIKFNDNELENIVNHKKEENNIKIVFSCISLEDFYFLIDLILKN